MSVELLGEGQRSLPGGEVLLHHGGAHGVLRHVRAQCEGLKRQTHEPHYGRQVAHNTEEEKLKQAEEQIRKRCHRVSGSHEAVEADFKGEHLPYGCVEAGQETGQGFSAIRVRQQTHGDNLLLCLNRPNQLNMFILKI